jgi:adenylate cyclase
MRGSPKRSAVILIGIAIAVAHLAFLLVPDVFNAWNSRVSDRLFVLRSQWPMFRPAYDETIVHVDLNDSTLRDYGFDVGRRQFARVVDTLRASGIAAQAYDFVFVSRTADEDDDSFIRAVNKANNVYFGAALFLSSEAEYSTRLADAPDETSRYAWSITVDGQPGDVAGASGALSTLPALASASRGLGFLNTTADPDGVYRRVPLLIRVGEKFYPSLALRVICDYLSVAPAQVSLRPRSSLTLRTPRLRGAIVPDITIPLTRDNMMLLNFIGPSDRMTHYSLGALLDVGPESDQIDQLRAQLSGRIVLVAETSTGASDVSVTPIERRSNLAGLHSTVMNSILTRRFLREASSREAFAAEFVIAIALLVVALAESPRWLFAGAAALACGCLVAATAAFLFGSMVVNVVRPTLIIVLATALTAGHRYFHEQRDKLVVRRMFEAYFPPAVVEKIVRNPLRISGYGEKKELTIVFSDIQGFTARCLTMTASDVQSMLNDYFGRMVEIVFRHGGTIDKFMGDGLMVFFGDPEEQPDHALRAVRAAVDMQREIAAMNQRLPQAPIKVRIGITTGAVVVGNMGSARRLSYTVLGSPVNLAQRLESMAPAGGILISERTHALLAGTVPAVPRGRSQFKGLEEPVPVFEVLFEPGSVSPGGLAHEP